MKWLGMMWLGLTLAEPVTPPDAELLEFLGSFETNTGQWPELSEAVAKKPVTEPPARMPKRETKR